LIVEDADLHRLAALSERGEGKETGEGEKP
jgi:hypothetical protein